MKKYHQHLNFFGKDAKTFNDNKIFRNAISMPVFQICELVKTLNKEMPEFTKANSEIPWKNIIQMRERFAHHYVSMDYNIVFETALNDVPQLYKFIKNYLKNNQ